MSCILHMKFNHYSILFLTFIFINNVHVTRCRNLSADKRTLVATGGNESPGQLDEIFDASNHIDVSYDEYPMVVPKRSQLFLDRLMVALHRALEKERADQRKINELYESNSFENQTVNSEQDSLQYNMYNGDDPSVLMDYDFKDLNSINRATGETLMTNGFQRRASLGSNRAAATTVKQRLASQAGNDIASIIGRSGGGGRSNAIGSGSRKYWRCYFNAVTCF